MSYLKNLPDFRKSPEAMVGHDVYQLWSYAKDLWGLSRKNPAALRNEYKDLHETYKMLVETLVAIQNYEASK